MLRRETRSQETEHSKYSIFVQDRGSSLESDAIWPCICMQPSKGRVRSGFGGQQPSSNIFSVVEKYLLAPNYKKISFLWINLNNSPGLFFTWTGHLP